MLFSMETLAPSLCEFDLEHRVLSKQTRRTDQISEEEEHNREKTILFKREGRLFFYQELGRLEKDVFGVSKQTRGRLRFLKRKIIECSANKQEGLLGSPNRGKTVESYT
jgi:hypothetical protein